LAREVPTQLNGLSKIQLLAAREPLAPELLPLGYMLKRLGLRILDLIDTIPLGWLEPHRRPVPVPVRRFRRPYAR